MDKIRFSFPQEERPIGLQQAGVVFNPEAADKALLDGFIQIGLAALQQPLTHKQQNEQAKNNR